jgi:uncharacterized protein (DUF1778 family)
MAVRRRAVETENLTFRVSLSDKDILEQAALKSGSDITAFVLSPALTRAREIVQRDEVTHLTGEARRRFVSLVEQPPAPSDSLIRNLKDGLDRIVE